MAHHGFHSRYQDKEYAAEDAKAWTLDLSNEQEEKNMELVYYTRGFSWVFMGFL